MRAGEFSELTAFAAVAEARSFRQAAVRLNLRPSTLSHAVRALEERLGVKLLARTTRSVAPTPAGEALLAQITPALAVLDRAVESIAEHRARPQGPVRLTVFQNAASMVIAPKLGAFVRDYPDVTLEVSVNDGLVDIVKDGFDAGIRLGEDVGAGMTAVRVSGDVRAAVAATPEYWRRHGRPETPFDLAKHRCINRRYGPGRALYRWRFARGGETIEVASPGPLILDAEWLMRRAALDGAGVVMLAEGDVADDVAAGRLQLALQDWCPPIFSYYLYHPSHRLPSASLAALISTLRIG